MTSAKLNGANLRKAVMQGVKLSIKPDLISCADKREIYTDGKYITAGFGYNGLKIWDFDSLAPIKAPKYRFASSVSPISPDGKFVLHSSSNIIYIYDVATGAYVHKLEEHKDSLDSLIFTSNSKFIISGSRDKTIKIWDMATGQCMRTLEGHTGWVYSVCTSPDSKYIISGSYDKTIKIWDMAIGQCMHTLEGHTGSVYSVCTSPDSKYIISGSYDTTLKIWDLASAKCLQTLKGHTKHVYSVYISPDSKYIASGSEDSTVKIWDFVTGQCIKTIAEHTMQVNNVGFSNNGKYIVSASDDGKIKIWDFDISQILQELFEPQTFYDRHISSSGKYFIVNGKEIEVRDFFNIAHKQILGHSAAVNQTSVSVMNNKYLVSGCYDGTIIIRDIASGQCLQTLVTPYSFSEDISISTDSKYIMSKTNYYHLVTIWDVLSGKCLHKLELKYKQDSNILSDSKHIVFLELDRTFKILDIVTAQCLQTFVGHTDDVCSVDISPDSKHILSSSEDKTVKIWDFASGVCLQTLELNNPIRKFSISPDSKYIFTEIYLKLLLWDFNGQCLKTFESEKSGISSDGKYLLCVPYQSAKIRVWDVINLKEMKDLNYNLGYSKYIKSFSIFPDNKLVAAAGDTNVISIRDIATGQYMQKLTVGSAGSYSSIKYLAPDAKFMVSFLDKTMRVWKLKGDKYFLYQEISATESSLSAEGMELDGAINVSESYEEVFKQRKAIFDPQSLQTKALHNSNYEENMIIYQLNQDKQQIKALLQNLEQDDKHKSLKVALKSFELYSNDGYVTLGKPSNTTSQTKIGTQGKYPVQEGSNNCTSCCQIFAQTGIKYDNPLLNNPSLLQELSGIFGANNVLELSSNLTDKGHGDFLQEVIQGGDLDLLLGLLSDANNVIDFN